jgi:methionyl-tRNA formyltransferase
MRVGFAGTPEFAACALSAIREHGHTIALVLTQPDRPSGRGLALAAPAVKRYAVEHRLPLLQPPTLRSPAAQAELAQIPLDVLVVAAYGLILPRAVLDWPRHGCLNIHASLLPRWRGAAPIARAIEAGDATTGITVMQMEEGLDTGPIIARSALAIDTRETAGSLHDRLAALGARMIVEALARLGNDGALQGTPQPASGISYAAKIERRDTLIDWREPSSVLDRRVRALSPLPGAVAGWRGAGVRIRRAVPLDRRSDREPGTVVAVGNQGIDVACGVAADAGMLRLTELQPAAGRVMPASAFAAGRSIAPGARFEPGR